MGWPLTVELAEIRVTELETIALNTSPQPPSLYKHFVDDGFGVFRDKTHAETYLEYVNSLSSDLVYTIEHPSQDGSIPFLDILIHKDLSTSVYRKSTHTDTYTHYSTATPQTTKDSLIRSLTRRAYNICSPQHLDLELTHVKSVLLDNGYPLNHIKFNLIMHRTKNSLSKPKTPRAKDNGNLANISVPYYPALSKDIYLTVITYHSHSPPIGTYVTCSQKRRLNHHLTPLAMSFIKCHAKTAAPHTVVKHVAHFTQDFQNTKDSPTTLNHSHPPTYNTLQQLHITLTQQATP